MLDSFEAKGFDSLFTLAARLGITVFLGMAFCCYQENQSYRVKVQAAECAIAGVQNAKRN